MHACSLRASARRAAQQLRSLSVVAWGRNVEGQCGLPENLILDPAVIESLEGVSLRHLAAGRAHSGAVTADGQLLTWGSGQCGQLGHGTAEDVGRPMRVESLVSRAHVSGAALGHSHSLFLDSEGALWSCGENKEGQCGYGTSLEVIAAQRRQEWAIGANFAAFATAAEETLAGIADEAGEGGGTSEGREQQQQVSAPTGWQGLLMPLEQHTKRQQEVEEVKSIFRAGVSMRALGPESSFGAFGSSKKRGAASNGGRSPAGGLAAIMGAFGQKGGLMPGQTHTPTRIGRDAHPLFSPGGADGGDSTCESASMASHVVTSVVASRYFSAAATTDGKVFTWGSGFGGELGHGAASWVTSARQVGGDIGQALEDNGGAKKIVAGDAGFCACLTHSGRLVVWGNVPGVPSREPAVRSGSVCVTEVLGLPPMVDIAAGHSHLVMTDGERCWAMGSWLSGGGMRVCIPWGCPEEQLAVAGGIVSVSAGSQASGAVTGDGELWMWGRLLEHDSARALCNRHGAPKALKAQLEDWSWPGMGSELPQLVAGLDGVQAVHFGAAHALAVIA